MVEGASVGTTREPAARTLALDQCIGRLALRFFCFFEGTRRNMNASSLSSVIGRLFPCWDRPHGPLADLSSFLSIIARVLVLLFLTSVGSPAECAESQTRIPVLVYHRFGPVVADSMTVTTAVLEAQLRLLHEEGYHVISIHELIRALADTHYKLPSSAVVLTVDDGHRSVYTDLFPLICKYGVPVTLFIYPSAISNAAYALTWDQLDSMVASGLVDVESHSYWHPNFKVEQRRLTPDAFQRLVVDQLVRSKATLERHLGRTVDLLAWPFGIYDASLMKAASSAGYVAAFSIDRRPVTAAEALMALPRYIVSDRDRGVQFEHLLKGPVEVAPRVGY